MLERRILGSRPKSRMLGLDLLSQIGKNQLDFYTAMQAEHGDAVPIRFFHLTCWFLFHPDHIETVLHKRSGDFIRDPRLMNIMTQWAGRSVFIVEGKDWKDRRRALLPGYATSRLPAYAGAIARLANGLADDWARDVDTDGVHRSEIFSAMSQYTLRIVFHEVLGTEDLTALDPMHTALQRLLQLALVEVSTGAKMPNFVPTAHNVEKQRLLKYLKSTVRRYAQARLDAPVPPETDLLGAIVKACDSNLDAITDEIMTLLTAGSDTSGGTLCWLFYALSSHPGILERVHAELDDLGDAPLDYSALERMPLLMACIDEVVRLYPTTYAIPGRRAECDVDMGDFVVKKGQIVQLVPYVTQRDPRWFANADQFDPDRHLRPRDWPQYASFAFGFGPRICIGRAFALMEIGLTAATLLRRFTLEPKAKGITPVPWFLLRPEGPITLGWVPR